MSQEAKLEKLKQKLTLKGEDYLDQEEKALKLAVCFALDMVDGDLNDYFFNVSGKETYALVEALKHLGADDVAEVMESALSCLDAPLPEDIEARQAVLVAVDDETLEDWDNLTEDYYDLEPEFWNLLISKT